MAIRIVTDSVADLAPALASANDITVVPAYVIIGSETYKDGVEITADRFYSRLAGLSRLPTTSQPTIGDFQEVYQRLLDQGHQVVSVHVSSKLSGTVNSATQAKAALGDSSQIEIVDSQLASAPMALAVLSAAQWARDTSDYRDVARRVRQSLVRNHGFILVDTLEYLQKGGRIGKAQAFVGGMLKVKPILTIRDGEVHPVERPRSLERAKNRIIEIARELAPVRQVNVIYSTDRVQALALRAELAELVDPEHLIESRFGPTLGTYLGPNALGVAVTQGVPEEG
jgi:DegV family protein with EDD domain